MKTIKPYHLLARLQALSMLIVPAAVSALSLRPCDFPARLCEYALCAFSLLALYPQPHEDAAAGLRRMSILTVSYIAAFVIPLSPVLVTALVPAAVLSCCCHSAAKRFSRLRSLFRSNAQMAEVEVHSSLLLCLLVSALSPVTLLAMTAERGLPAVAAAIAVLFCLQYFRILTGRNLVIGKEKRKLLTALMKRVQSNLLPEDEDSLARMNTLYDRAVEYMETHRPFVDPNLTLQDLATALYTNRSYLSRTINAVSGRNTRQFINSFRVGYAVDLMKQDCHLQVQEVAAMSGFNTPVSFSMAFKVHMGEAPSNYLRNLMIAEHPLQRPSSRKEREQ